MSLELSGPFSFRIALYVAIIISLLGCTPAATLRPQSIEPFTPTPEIFNPLDPSPTLSDSILPLTCQVTDLNVYINEQWGYCFAYPMEFTVDESGAVNGIVSLYGPPLEDNPDPVRISLEITTQPVPEGSDLAPLVDAYLTLFQGVPLSTTREPWLLGSDPAEKLEPIPGLLSSRVVMAVHQDLLFTLRFHPSDIDFARPGLDDLTQTVTGSFGFLPVGELPAREMKHISWLEFGQDISLTYDPALAPWVEARTVPAVPVSDSILFSESHPALTQIRFVGFHGGRAYQLPVLPAENGVAQVMLFKTSEFPGFGDDHPQGFVNQLEALTALLQTGVDPAFCAQPLMGDAALPFLPWVNSRQSFCAQPKLIEFAGGKGIRYVTYYTQGVGPVLDPLVFYTFQGLTDDGQFYVSALFPVTTGVFPAEAPPCSKCGEADYNPLPQWEAELTEQLSQLNAQPEDEFAPSLKVLDQLITSIQVGQ